MDHRIKIAGASALVWGGLGVLGLVLLLLQNAGPTGDVYDVEWGLRVIGEGPALLVGMHLAYGWCGVAMVFMVVAFDRWLHAGADAYLGRVAAAFGLLAGGFFVFFGLIGAFGYFDLAYIASQRSIGYVGDAFLPLRIITNRVLAAGTTIMGFWFTLTSWTTLRLRSLPRGVSLFGLGIGLVVLLGLVLPGGGFSFLGLLVAPLWAIAAGVSLLRTQLVAAAPALEE